MRRSIFIYFMFILGFFSLHFIYHFSLSYGFQHLMRIEPPTNTFMEAFHVKKDHVR